ncbi:MAG: MurR/RpiR family transcriptional regulator [Tissierellia bacterium]|nr:MurR/RpiR family transcriptional regulator [Tissierellia bacterium]
MSRMVLTKINQGMNSFTPSEKKIAKYILENPQEAMKLSVAEMAKKSKTSEASVIRFCKTLGLAGYQDLKLGISMSIVKKSKGKRIIHEIINVDDTPSIIMEKMALGSIQAIEETKQILNLDNLDKAIKAIDNAERVYFFGAGASSIVALDAQYKFTRINIPSFMYFDNHIELTSVVHLTDKDVAVGISHSGRTKETIDILNIAKERNATTIAITQYGKNPIEEAANIVLHTANVENNFRSGAMASRIAQLYVIDSLFIGVACKRYDDVNRYLEITREALESKKI